MKCEKHKLEFIGSICPLCFREEEERLNQQINRQRKEESAEFDSINMKDDEECPGCGREGLEKNGDATDGEKKEKVNKSQIDVFGPGIANAFEPKQNTDGEERGQA